MTYNSLKVISMYIKQVPHLPYLGNVSYKKRAQFLDSVVRNATFWPKVSKVKTGKQHCRQFTSQYLIKVLLLSDQLVQTAEIDFTQKYSSQLFFGTPCGQWLQPVVWMFGLQCSGRVDNWELVASSDSLFSDRDPWTGTKSLPWQRGAPPTAGKRIKRSSWGKQFG